MLRELSVDVRATCVLSGLAMSGVLVERGACSHV